MNKYAWNTCQVYTGTEETFGGISSFLTWLTKTFFVMKFTKFSNIKRIEKIKFAVGGSRKSISPELNVTCLFCKFTSDRN